MTNEARMTNVEWLARFVIEAWTFIRHLEFVIRHSPPFPIQKSCVASEFDVIHGA